MDLSLHCAHTGFRTRLTPEVEHKKHIALYNRRIRIRVALLHLPLCLHVELRKHRDYLTALPLI
jgi:hypothetical protein